MPKYDEQQYKTCPFGDKVCKVTCMAFRKGNQHRLDSCWFVEMAQQVAKWAEVQP